ncbi:MAG: sel1 repeat family protein [Proteobacteria bacterium]|nr:sel1 repeat family protein [Pseudomonadota bacterium]
MRPLRLAVFSGLLLAALGLGPAAAIMWKDYTRAIAEAENRKDYPHAFNEALVLALAGENTGYDLLARYYATGTVVPTDLGVAARIVCLAAERGDRNAQIRLALLYAEGKGVPANPARQWLWAEIAGRDLNTTLREQYGINKMQQAASQQIKMADEDALRALAGTWQAEKAHPSDRFGKYCP